MTRERMYEFVTFLKTGQFDLAIKFAQGLFHVAPDDRAAFLYRGMAYRASRRFEEAMADLTEAARIAELSHDVELAAAAHYQRGVVHAETKDWTAAYAAFKTSTDAAEPDSDRCAGMCQALCRLGRYDEAIEWRNRAIKMRDQEATCRPQDVAPRFRPKSFCSKKQERNIVSYCLFGDDTYYHECAVTVARITPFMFPEFTARFYCSPDLPKPVARALVAAKAQVAVTGDQDSSATSPFAGTFWRFLAFDDPGVDVVLCRDVDSPILPRERAAIDLWLRSDAPYYTLRDNPIHAEPMLAGMWGGFTKLLPPLGPLAYEYARSDHSKYADQRFLRQVIWPRIRGATLSIDSYDALGTSVDFPPGFPKVGQMHVGISWSRHQILGLG